MMDAAEKQKIVPLLVKEWTERRLCDLASIQEEQDEASFFASQNLLARLKDAVDGFDAGAFSSIERKVQYQRAFTIAVDAVAATPLEHVSLRGLNATLALNGLDETVIGPLLKLHNKIPHSDNVVELSKAM